VKAVIKHLSLFSGVGAFESAMRNLQIPFEITNYCEIGTSQSKAYSLIHGISEEKNLHDITQVDETKLGHVDFITYGFPCQDISRAGTQKGFTDEDGNKTRSGLFFDAARIIKATQPIVAIAENVKPLVGNKFKAEFQTVLETLDDAGYNNYWKVLKASDFGVPQSRERVFIVSIRKDVDTGIFQFPVPYQLEKCMMDYLETDVDSRYFLSDKMFAYVLDLEEKQQGTKWEGRANNDFINPRIAHTLSVRGIKGQRAGVSNIISIADPSPIKVLDYKKKLTSFHNTDLRNLTERESFRLMGFKDSEFDAIQNHFSQTDLYTFAGNSIVVDVAEELLCMMFDEDGNFFI